MNIPMKTTGPMRTSDLGQINRTGKAQTLQTLLPQSQPPARPAPAPVRPAPTPVRPAPAPVRPAPAPVRPAPAPARPAPPPPRRAHPPVSGTQLQRGQKISLTQLEPHLDLAEVGLGWDLGPGGQGYELDVEAFLLGPNGKVPGDDWFVFYNQPVSPDGAVRLAEPPSTQPGDDAAIQLRLSRVSPGVSRIVLILTIHDARDRGCHFGNVERAYVRLVSQPARRELVRFQLSDCYPNVCSMVVGELYRYQNEWRFNPVGSGTGDDLAGLCTRYGVEV